MKIQVAMEQTSQEILSKIEETGGVTTGADNKKYRPIMEDGMVIPSKFNDMQMTVPNNYVYKDEDYVYLFNNYGSVVYVFNHLDMSLLATISIGTIHSGTAQCIVTTVGDVRYGVDSNKDYMFMIFRDAASGNSGHYSKLAVIDKKTLTVKVFLTNTVFGSQQLLSLTIANDRLYIMQAGNVMIYSYPINDIISQTTNNSNIPKTNEKETLIGSVKTDTGLYANVFTQNMSVIDDHMYFTLRPIDNSRRFVTKYPLTELDKGRSNPLNATTPGEFPKTNYNDNIGIIESKYSNSIFIMSADGVYEFDKSTLVLMKANPITPPYINQFTQVIEDMNGLVSMFPVTSYRDTLTLLSRNYKNDESHMINIKYPYGPTLKTEMTLDGRLIVTNSGKKFYHLQQTRHMLPALDTKLIIGYEEVI